MVLPAENRKPPFQKFHSRFLKVYETDEGWTFASRKDETVYDAVLREKEIVPDAVVICAIVPDYEREGTGEHSTALVVINQYRPPIGQFIYELPAGLVDEGEDPVDAGLREFKEETGMEVIRVLDKSPITYASPGFCDESAQIIYIEAKGVPSQDHQEAAEDIEIILMEEPQVEEMLASGNPVGARLAICAKLFLTGGLGSFIITAVAQFCKEVHTF
tara:strand:- start:2268 stop:2918 length:651 start_codon:yes stop_codon:yes gene_type:complete